MESGSNEHSRPQATGTASGSRQCGRDSIWNPTLGYPQGKGTAVIEAKKIQEYLGREKLVAGGRWCQV